MRGRGRGGGRVGRPAPALPSRLPPAAEHGRRSPPPRAGAALRQLGLRVQVGPSPAQVTRGRAEGWTGRVPPVQQTPPARWGLGRGAESVGRALTSPGGGALPLPLPVCEGRDPARPVTPGGRQCERGRQASWPQCGVVGRTVHGLPRVSLSVPTQHSGRDGQWWRRLTPPGCPFMRRGQGSRAGVRPQGCPSPLPGAEVRDDTARGGV